MGQQQVLLVILVTIIVGLVTVVAIRTFSAAAEGTNLNEVRQDVASIAASAQGYFIKPAILEGGGNKFIGLSFRNLSFRFDSVSEEGDVATNQNGTYEIVSVSEDDFIINAYPSRAEGYVSGMPSGPFISAKVTKDGLEWTKPDPGTD